MSDTRRTLRIQAPGQALRSTDLLARALPGAPVDLLEGWLRAGVVRVGDVPVLDRDAPVKPGCIVHVAIGADRFDAAYWPELRATGQGAFVWVPASPFRRGRLTIGSPHEAEVSFEVVAEHEGLSQLWLQWPASFGADTDTDADAGDDDAARLEAARLVLERLAASGLCVLGDPFHAGLACEGGPAWRSEEAAECEADARVALPPISPFIETLEDSPRPAWVVSDATARILGRGHPWIRLDAETGAPGVFAPGQRVDIVNHGGRVQGQALVEGAGRAGLHAIGEGGVAGRVVALGEAEDWSVEACVARALARRERWLDDCTHTDAFRLIHGEADGLPGLHVDRLGALVRVLVTARCALPLVDRVLVALGSGGERVIPNPWRIVEVVHLDERLPEGLERVRVHPYSADADGAAEHARSTTVRETGLVYRVDAGLAEPERSAPGYGLFLDQRENRAAFVKHARRGGRFLNLFAHTGAFSVALLAAGADAVTSVDLSGGILRRLEANLEANTSAGVDPSRHESVRQDGRRYLEQLDADERFDGIVLDPPTAAAAGRRFFSVRKDAVPMIAHCLEHLAPGGRLLVTLNDRKARRRLEAAIGAAAEASGVELHGIEAARPSGDFPLVEGFDEGDPFVGFVARRAGQGE